MGPVRLMQRNAVPLHAQLPRIPVGRRECPAPQKLARPGVLKETPTQVAIVGQFLASGESNKTVPLVEVGKDPSVV